MKRALLIVSSMVVISVVALGQQGQGDADRRTAQQKQLAEDDVALKSLIRRTAFSGHIPSPTVRSIANAYKIHPERMARLLEEIIRERLSDMEKAEGDGKNTPMRNVCSALQQLKDFHNAGTLALLRECVLSTNALIRHNAVRAAQELGVDLDDPNAVIQVTSPEQPQPPVIETPTEDKTVIPLPVGQDEIDSPPSQTEPFKEKPDNTAPKVRELQNDPVKKNSIQWKLPLLIAMFVIGGSVVTWRCFVRRTR